MAKQITIPYEGKTYTLEYNRTTVMALEKEGFRVGEIDTLTNITLLIIGAFRMHHSSLTRAKTLEIYKKAVKKNRDDFIAKLNEMCSETYLTLLNDPETEDEGTEDEQGNCGWEASW